MYGHAPTAEAEVEQK